MDLTLTTHTHIIGAIVDAVLSREDHRAFVFTPTDPIPARRVAYRDPEARRAGNYSSAYWSQDGPTFARVKRVENWGWLRRNARGYGEPGLVHPSVGTAFHVRQWRYIAPGQAGRSPIDGRPHFYMRDERFSPVFIARLSDGRIFADQWADPSVLHDALSRWRNASGYTCDWQTLGMDSVPTCAIGGLDWATIPETITAHRARVTREREYAAERAAARA